MVLGGGSPNEGGSPPDAEAAGTASILIARSNPARLRIAIINDSDTVIYVARSDFARLNAGIRLNANGGSIIDEVDSFGRVYTGPWSAITTAANKVLCISEQ